MPDAAPALTIVTPASPMREARPVDASAIASADDAEKVPLLTIETLAPATATPFALESAAEPSDATRSSASA